MRFPLLGQLVILFVAFSYTLAAPSSGDRQQGRLELQDGHLLRRDKDAALRHSRKPLLSTTTATSASFLTLVTPSPGASVISITSQGQIITSYSPLTVCPDSVPSYSSPALPSANVNASVPFFNTTTRFPRRHRPAPYANSTTTSAPSVPGSAVSSCSVTYIPTTTPICHTTLTPLGGIPLPISACDQSVTFSTDHGVASTTTGALELQTTYYVAPWLDVVAGVPTGIVEEVICGSVGRCETAREKWSISTAMVTETRTDTLSVDTVVTGPALVILPPTSTLTLTDESPSSISTVMVYQVFPTTTSLAIVRQTLSEGSAAPLLTTGASGSVPSTTVTRTSTSTMTVTLQGTTQTMTIWRLEGWGRWRCGG